MSTLNNTSIEESRQMHHSDDKRDDHNHQISAIIGQQMNRGDAFRKELQQKIQLNRSLKTKQQLDKEEETAWNNTPMLKRN